MTNTVQPKPDRDANPLHRPLALFQGACKLHIQIPPILSTAFRHRYLMRASSADSDNDLLGINTGHGVLLCAISQPSGLLWLPMILIAVPKRTGPEAKYPTMDLMGHNNEQMCEAQAWIQKMKTLWDHHIIENNHIFYFGKKEYDILSQLQENTGVSICEILNPGRACLELKGAQADLIQGIMNIEHMLCEVQEEVARKKEQALWSLSGE